MKTVVINADPKRRGNTAKLMKSALRGVESAGSETTYVDLYKFDLSGCRACLICKNDEETCKCYWKDELSSLIDEILDADCLLIGVPVFFANPSSHYLALLERLIFCTVSYTGSKFKGKLNIGLFYTIEYPKSYFEKSVRPSFKLSEDLLRMLNGRVTIEVFHNISKNERSTIDSDSIKSKEDQFESDLESIYKIAADLCS